MSSHIETNNLRLVLNAPEHLRALIQGPEFYQRSFGSKPADGLRDFIVSKDVSLEWLARLETATTADPWIDGFVLLHVASSTVIGMAGFKGPPGADGIVEIAYAVVPDYRGKGLATEAAEALVAYAFRSNLVRVVQAHTLPNPNASTRVLAKCGFQYIGEVTDPEDGLIWRWEKHNAGV